MKVWDTICAPKEAGGLGIQRMHDINTAFITKLTWLLITRTDKLWVQVLKARYCYGTNFMVDQVVDKNGLWVWKSIINCTTSFMRGACLKVERNSRLKIWDTPWIPFAPRFKVPVDVVLPESLQYVKDLMNSARIVWNISLLHNHFPLNLVGMMMKVGILDEPKQDAVLWVPSKTRNFSIMSCYRENHREMFSHNSTISRD